MGAVHLPARAALLGRRRVRVHEVAEQAGEAHSAPRNRVLNAASASVARFRPAS